MKKILFFFFALTIFALKLISQPRIIKDLNTQTADAFSTEREFMGNFRNY